MSVRLRSVAGRQQLVTSRQVTNDRRPMVGQLGLPGNQQLLVYLARVP
jgi:hypothetical protein